MAHEADLVGRTIAGRFRITGLLGQGAMASVYRGEQDNDPKLVAVKIMHPHLASDTTILKRFRREARAASVLVHPNVVRIVDFGVEGALAFIVMELLVGRDVFDTLDRERRLPQARAVRIVHEIAVALADAHRHGIIHRDLKPENVMLVPDPSVPWGERVKVLDFGIAKVLEQEHNENMTHTGLTSVGSVVGTPSYMSPEQCQGLVIDARSDLYACGVLLYQLVTGKPPFVDEDPVAVMIAHVREPPFPPSQKVAGLDPGVERVILKALSKGPRQRHQNAEELASELAEVLRSLEKGAAVSTPPPPAPDPGAAVGAGPPPLAPPRIPAFAYASSKTPDAPKAAFKLPKPEVSAPKKPQIPAPGARPASPSRPAPPRVDASPAPARTAPRPSGAVVPRPGARSERPPAAHVAAAPSKPAPPPVIHDSETQDDPTEVFEGRPPSELAEENQLDDAPVRPPPAAQPSASEPTQVAPNALPPTTQVERPPATQVGSAGYPQTSNSTRPPPFPTGAPGPFPQSAPFAQVSPFPAALHPSAPPPEGPTTHPMQVPAAPPGPPATHPMQAAPQRPAQPAPPAQAAAQPFRFDVTQEMPRHPGNVPTWPGSVPTWTGVPQGVPPMRAITDSGASLRPSAPPAFTQQPWSVPTQAARRSERLVIAIVTLIVVVLLALAIAMARFYLR